MPDFIFEPDLLIPSEPDFGGKTCIILKHASQRGQEVLICSNGHQYNLRNDNKEGYSKHYRCRKNKGSCKAKIEITPSGAIKVKDTLDHEHNHPPIYSHMAQAQYLQELRRMAVQRPFETPTALITELLKESGHLRSLIEAIGLGTACTQIFNLRQLVRAVRRRELPPAITGLWDFIDLSFFPVAAKNFIKFDLSVRTAHGGGRFLGLANDMMLDFMFRADIWFIDATFKPVRRPFRQLLVVHVVFNQGARQASIPVFYILMSNRTTVNYMRCFKSMLRIVERHGQGKCVVRTIIIDFEYAMWQAFRNMIANSYFDDLTISGCLFHFCQCIYRRVQLLHLAGVYRTHRLQRLIIKSLMALPLLPVIHIKSEFERLHRRVKRLFANNPIYAQLLKLCVYVSKQ